MTGAGRRRAGGHLGRDARGPAARRRAGQELVGHRQAVIGQLLVVVVKRRCAYH